MYGLAGVVDISGNGIDPMLLQSMTDVIRFRGPDDEGYVLIHQGTSHAKVFAGPDSAAVIRESLPLFRTCEMGFPANIGLNHRRVAQLLDQLYNVYRSGNLHSSPTYN